MKKGWKKALVGVGLSVMTLGASAIAGCSPVANVKGWFNQLFCKHENKEIVEAVEPTCLEDGYTEYEKCTDCGKEVTKGAVLEATGHTIEVKKGYAATCTTLGLTDEKSCAVCGEVVEAAKYIAVLGHKKVEVKEKAATCEEAGLTAGVICGNGCGTIYSGCEEIPMLGHRYKDFYCLGCGAIDYDQVEMYASNGYNYLLNNMDRNHVGNGTYLQEGQIYLIDYEYYDIEDLVLADVTPACGHSLDTGVSSNFIVGDSIITGFSDYSLSCWYLVNKEDPTYKDCQGNEFYWGGNRDYEDHTNEYDMVLIDDRYTIVYFKENPYSKDEETGELYWTSKVKVEDGSGIFRMTFKEKSSDPSIEVPTDPSEELPGEVVVDPSEEGPSESPVEMAA